MAQKEGWHTEQIASSRPRESEAHILTTSEPPSSAVISIIALDGAKAELLSVRAQRRIREAEYAFVDGEVDSELFEWLPKDVFQADTAYAEIALRGEARLPSWLVQRAREGCRSVWIRGTGGLLDHAGIVGSLEHDVTLEWHWAHDGDHCQPPTGSRSSFSQRERDVFYRIVASRRDMRHFAKGAQIPDPILQRILDAAHQAPSVGLMQPWRFLRIVDPHQRHRIARLVEQERQATASALGARDAEFLKLKVEGIAECAELLVVILAPDDGTIFGRRTLPLEMALCTVGCSVENLWLAARAENLGLGWVSLFDPKRLGEVLELPPGALPLGVLCIGPVKSFYEAPMLQVVGWRKPRPLNDMVFVDRWGAPSDER